MVLDGLQFLLILALGVVYGALARLVLPGRQDVTWSETIVAGIAGAAVGGMASNLISNPDRPWAVGLGTAVAALGGTIVVMLGLVAWKKGRQRPRRTPTARLIASGESDDIEFKQTARTNIHTNSRDPKVEMAIAKTVAGFLNGEGGTLLIGVADDGTVTSIEPDLPHMKSHDLDRYELWLSDYLGRTLGTTSLTFVDVTFDEMPEGAVARVDVEPSDRPVFLDEPGGTKTADFYVRLGNSTRQLRTDEVLEYQRTRWS